MSQKIEQPPVQFSFTKLQFESPCYYYYYLSCSEKVYVLYICMALSDGKCLPFLAPAQPCLTPYASSLAFFCHMNDEAYDLRLPKGFLEKLTNFLPLEIVHNRDRHQHGLKDIFKKWNTYDTYM